MQHISSDERIASHIAAADRIAAERDAVSAWYGAAAWAVLLAGVATLGTWFSVTGGAW